MIQQAGDFSRHGDFVPTVRIADFIVADFQRHREPGRPEIAQLDIAGLHDVVERDSLGRCRRTHPQFARKSAPAVGKALLQIANERIEALPIRRIKIRCDARCQIAIAELETGAAFDNTIAYHLRDDDVDQFRTQRYRPDIRLCVTKNATIQIIL